MHFVIFQRVLYLSNKFLKYIFVHLLSLVSNALYEMHATPKSEQDHLKLRNGFVCHLISFDMAYTRSSQMVFSFSIFNFKKSTSVVYPGPQAKHKAALATSPLGA